MDVSAALTLARELHRWSSWAEDVLVTVELAERLADEPTGVQGLLGDIAATGMGIAQAVGQARQTLLGFVIDPGFAGVLSLLESASQPHEPPRQELKPSARPGDLALFQTGDDLDLSNRELNAIAGRVSQLSLAERNALFLEVSDTQLERLFHNVHAKGWLTNDWGDHERGRFYDNLVGLTPAAYQRINRYTDYFDDYDPAPHPATVDWDEAEFLTGYNQLVQLDLDEFLAVRSHLWSNDVTRAHSPFDWHADGCSIPLGHYPDELDGPCLVHDFAYRNARLAAARYNPAFNDITSPAGQAWKEAADLRLYHDIVALESTDHDFDAWAEVVYRGVTVELPWGPSGRRAFEQPYRVHYGPGFAPFLGEARPGSRLGGRIDELVAVATVPQ
jgi:hypothetical protein